MATARRKAMKRAAAAKRAKPARKPKSSRPKSAGALKPGKRESAGPKSEITRLKRQLDAAQNETQEALERQTATGDILKVIASSPSDVQPVFDAIAESAKRLFGSHTAVVTRVIDGVVHFAAGTAENEAATHAIKSLLPYPLSSPRIHARVARTGELAINTDSERADLPQSVKELARAMGWRSFLVVPMLRNGTVIGTIGITRREPGSFADKAIDLLKTFADQAVIAIENVRLFDETREALERQTATADILKVIASSPSDVQPVFEAIAERAKRLVGAHATTVLRVVGDMFDLAAFTPVSEEADATLRASFPLPIANNPQFEGVHRGEIAEVADTESEMYAYARIKDIARARGFRSRILVPLKNENGTVGAISVTRVEPGAFAEHHVQLLQTFADQAVIAIENARLFNETQQALARQTATADILKVIASSPSDTTPVFEAIATTGHRLLGGFSTTVFSIVDDMLHLSAFTPTSPSADAALQAAFPRPASAESWNHRVLNGETVEIPDVEIDPMVPE